jgi:four helix bundle protein
MPAKSFKDLAIWQRSIRLVEDIYELTRFFPKEEVYGLRAQIRRAVVSIPSNMAEGFARRHNAEYKQFLYVSLGSLAETSTQLIVAKNLGYLSGENAERLVAEAEEISKMTMGLIKKLT